MLVGATVAAGAGGHVLTLHRAGGHVLTLHRAGGRGKAGKSLHPPSGPIPSSKAPPKVCSPS